MLQLISAKTKFQKFAEENQINILDRSIILIIHCWLHGLKFDFIDESRHIGVLHADPIPR